MLLCLLSDIFVVMLSFTASLKELQCLHKRYSQHIFMFEGKAGSYPLHPRVGSWPCPQTLDFWQEKPASDTSLL